MFIKTKQRVLKSGGVALDFRLTEAYRDPEGKPRNRTIKTWTIRQTDLNFKGDRDQLIENIEDDLKWIGSIKSAERQKIISKAKKKLRRLKA